MACCIASLAQTGVTFVLHDATGATVPFATVYIYAQADTNTVLHSGVTDEQGRFTQEIASTGKYHLKATFVGMKAVEKDFEIVASQHLADLGTIAMDAEGKMLKGIEITSQRQLVKTEIDRIAYDIQADQDSKTSNVLEMLRKVPLVSVDGKEEIRVKGSTSFKIYRNGHPDPSFNNDPKQVLKALPANMIKRIEVITDPGAKYDAEGTTTILNIVMLDNSSIKGVTGTVSAGADILGDFNASANVTTQINKVVANVNYGYHRQGDNLSHNMSESTTMYGDTGNVLTHSNDSRATVNVHIVGLSASWEPDTLNLLSASANGFFYDYIGVGDNDVHMRNADGSTIYRYKDAGSTPGSTYYSLSGRADYQHKTHREGEALTLSYMISASNDRSNIESRYHDMEGVTFPYTGMSTRKKERFAEHTLQLDWTRPFALYHKIETGLKYINRLNESNYETKYTGAPELDRTTPFDHTTHVGALYLSHTFSRDKWSTRAGLRYEFSHLNARFPDGSSPNYSRNLSDWVPNASVEFKPNDFNSLKLAFSTSIQRPGISYLNPAVEETPTSKSFGNPRLESARIYLVALTYMRIGNSLTFDISPSVQMCDNRIVDVQYLEEGKQVSTYENALKSTFADLSGFVQWTIGPKTSLVLNGGVNYRLYESKKIGYNNKRWGGYIYAQLTQTLPWKLRLSVGGDYQSGTITGLYGYSSGLAYYNASLQRSFLKEDRLTVRLSAFNFFNNKFQTMKSYTTQGDFTGNTVSRYVNRVVSLTVSYRFGSLKASVKSTDTTINNSDLVGGNQK